MNPLVERAQRAYGSYLAAQGGPQAGSLWLEAQNAYLAVLDSARNGLADAMYEIARLLTEPETAASLGLEKADLLMALPDSWIPTVLSTSNLSTSDLLKVAFASTGEGCSVVLDRLLSQADQENDVEGLTAVLTLGNSQQRQQALVLLGHRIYLKGHEHLAASGLDPQEWVRQSDRFLQAVAEWIDAARSNGLEGSEYLRQLHQLSDHVEGRRTREEVNWILNALSRMFLTSFADLRR